MESSVSGAGGPAAEEDTEGRRAAGRQALSGLEVRAIGTRADIPILRYGEVPEPSPAALATAAPGSSGGLATLARLLLALGVLGLLAACLRIAA